MDSNKYHLYRSSKTHVDPFLDAIQFMVVPENRGHTAKFPRKTVLQMVMLLAFKENVVDDGVQVHPLTYLRYTWNILRHGLVACRVRSELVFLVER